MSEPLKDGETEELTRAHGIYNELMDLDLVLQDTLQMGALRAFLESTDQNHPSLVRLQREVSVFRRRVESLASAAVLAMSKGE